MTRRAAGAVLGLAAAVALAAGAAAPDASAKPRSIAVQAERGHVTRAAAALGRSGLKIQRRRGAQLQVVADARRVRALQAARRGRRPRRVRGVRRRPRGSQGVELPARTSSAASPGVARAC